MWRAHLVTFGAFVPRRCAVATLCDCICVVKSSDVARHHSPLELLVLADDRTGALETAGICSDVGWGPVTVTVLGRSAEGGVVRLSIPSTTRATMVDIATRHLDPASAAERVGAVDLQGARIVALKIDSTLRGNWATELATVQSITGRRIVLVPAFPAVGRICRDGEVFEHGRPVGEGTGRTDPRGSLPSSRPADYLRRAGVGDACELADADELAVWLAHASAGVAVCDAANDSDLDALANVWARADNVVFAGTARSIGAAASALLTTGEGQRGESVVLRPPLPLPAIVVCGSLHEMARRQIETMKHSSLADSVTILSTPIPDSFPVSHDAAERAAQELLARFEETASARRGSTLVIIGGDTAAAILGDDAMEVGGTVAPGVPWMYHGTQLVITRAGGFGNELSLVGLFSTKMDP